MSSLSQHLPRLLPLAASLGLAFGLTTHTQTVSAATLLVTDCSDGAGSGTLRNTIAAAVSGDTVQIPVSCSTITLTQAGAISIPGTISNLYINGPGSGALTIDGGDTSATARYNSVFISGNTGTLGLTGMTLTHAKYKGSNPTGGCVFSSGNVSLNDVIMDACVLSPPAAATLDSKGAALYAAGSVVMINSTITSNTSFAANSHTTEGGGIYAKKGVIVKYSTISNNFAAVGSSGGNSHGGGVFSAGAGDVITVNSTISNNSSSINSALQVDNPGSGSFTVSLNSSTISGNHSTSFQAVGTYWPTRAYNTTIAFNSAGVGSSTAPAGLYSSAQITMKSSIFANNTVTSGTAYDIFSKAASNPLIGSNNLIVATSNTGVPLGTISSCPLLGHLGSYGGKTQTIPLLVNSPAIDQGISNGTTTDQRGTGFSRSVGAGVDIGAYERQTGVTDDAIFFSRFEGRCD